VTQDKFHTENLHVITGAMVQNLVAQATRHLEFLHPCGNTYTTYNS